ncbi:serine hydrolase [Candidatus Omnitrophota bacterium]
MVLNGENRFPAASLVKIPIMLSYFAAADQGMVDLNDSLQFRSSDWVGGSGRLRKIPVGESYSLETLIELMVSNSDNIAANMLIGHLGLDYFDHSFQEFGLKNTNLARKMMDFKSRSAGRENYTTAEDMAYILESIYRQQLFSEDASRLCLELLKSQMINDRIPANLPEGVSVAHKTGLERGVCHDVGIVFTEKGNFLISVLTKHQNKSAKLSKRLIAQLALLAHNFYYSF